MTDPNRLEDRRSFAVELAREAGRRVCAHLSQSVSVERKSDDSPVTIADRQAEQWMRDTITAAYPRDTIMGEEHAVQQGDNEFRWILDPIDGTKSFIAGVPLFSTLVAVQREEESVIGVIELPALNLRIHAAVGGGAWHQQGTEDLHPARVADSRTLSEGLYLTSETRTFAERGAAVVHEQLESRAWYGRTWGDGYGYYLVATGRALAMVDPIMSLWDAAALLPILTESGGTFTDWAGNATVSSGEGIATNGHVQEEVLRITRPFAKPDRTGGAV